VISVAVQDKSSKLDEKTAILCRSGIYIYSRDEVLAWGVKPKQDKPYYREYRPAGVLVEAKDKFNMVPVTNLHPASDVDDANFHALVSGVTGGPIEVVALDDGEIGLKGRVAFFTRDSYDAFNAGTKETSAGIEKVVREVSGDDDAGYDFVVEQIKSVNHMAVVPRGRGGVNVRVMDNAAIIDRGIGGTKMAGKMKGGILEFLGIVKAKDENFKFSSALLEGVAKVHSLDEAGLEKEITGLMAHVNTLGDSEAKEVLVGLVCDCFKHPVEVIAAKEKVAAKVDELYVACRDADSAVVQRILDAEPAEKKEGAGEGKDEDKDKDKDGKKKPVNAKDSKPPDIEAIIESAVQKAVVSATDSFEAKIDAQVKKALGLDAEQKPGDRRPAGSISTDDAAPGEDVSFLVRGVFGNR
jgi:hypothetical protein